MVMALQIKKEKTTTRAVQYIFVSCHEVSYFQWHPFTLTRCETISDVCAVQRLIKVTGNTIVPLRKITFPSIFVSWVISLALSPRLLVAISTRRRRVKRVMSARSFLLPSTACFPVS